MADQTTPEIDTRTETNTASGTSAQADPATQAPATGGCGGGACGCGANAPEEQAAPAASATDAPAAGGCCGGGGCGCGAGSDVDAPVLDLRALPEPFRPGALLGVVATMPSRTGATVVSATDPYPLLSQIEAEWPGDFTIRVLEDGPQTWSMELIRVR